MASTFNARGTSISTFQIGKGGSTFRPSTSDPGGSNGDFWFDTTLGELKVRLGGAYELIRFGNLRLATNTISSANVNGDIIIDPNGSGIVQFSGHAKVINTAARMWVASTDDGTTAISQTSPGALLTAVDMTTTNKYTPGVMFGSTDSSFSTTNPKWSAGIFGYATENFAANTDAGMGIEFFGTADNAGATPTPTSLGTWTVSSGLTLATDLAVTEGGTGRSTSTTAYGLIAAGTTATGAHQTLAAGATTEILVGGGASALPVWTTATGTGAPVRANAPTFTGTVTVSMAGAIIRVDATSSIGSLIVQSVAGQEAGLQLHTGLAARWRLFKTGAAESGSNAGSNLELYPVSDAGAQLTSVFTVSRATSVLNFIVAPTFTDAATTRTNLGLGNVENTALSTWAGSTNITTVGTIATGTWDGTDIAVTAGGTGRSTSTTAYGLIAAGTTATGAHQTLATGTSSQVLIGGGASALPTWSSTPSGLTSVTATTFIGALNGNASTATASATSTIANDTTTNADMYPVWVTANTGNLPLKVTSTKLSYNPSTGTMTLITATNPGIIVNAAGRPGFQIVDSSPSGVAPWFEVIGDRNTASNDFAFGGFYVAAADRTDAEIANGKVLGGLAFAGTITPNDKTSIRTAASIVAWADGAWPVGGATAPMGLRVYVGDTPRTLGTTGVTYGDILALEIGKTGSIGINGAHSDQIIVSVTGQITGALTSYGIRITSEVRSDVTTAAVGFSTAMPTQATSFTLTQMTHFQAAGNTVGAGSTITTQYGFLVAANMTGATTNIGFLGNLAEDTNVWNFYAQGTAHNFFNGDVRIGSVTDVNCKILLAGNATGSTARSGARLTMTVQSDVTASFYGFYALPSTQATSFTCATVAGFVASQGTLGAGSTITTNIGFFSGDLTNGDNNVGFQGSVSAGSAKWNLYMVGTAKNYLAGTLLIGSTTDNGTDKLQLTGTLWTSSTAILNGDVIQSAGPGTLTIGGTSSGNASQHVGIWVIQDVHTTEPSSQLVGYSVSMRHNSGAYTIPTYAGYVSNAISTNGGTPVVTTFYGFFSTLSDTNANGATVGYAFYTDGAAGTGGRVRWGYYSGGTALNHFAGNTLIGSTTDSGHKLQVTGTSSFSGNMDLSSNLTMDRTGDAAAAQTHMYADAGQLTRFRMGTTGTVRWDLEKDNVAESGSNAGSGLRLRAYDDAGASLGDAITIVRATRVVTFPVAPAFTDAPTTRTNLGLGTAAVQNTGTSGANVPLLNGANTWSASQTYSAATSWSFSASTTRNHHNSSAGGLAALAQTMGGLLLTTGTLNTTNKYTPSILFGSTDADLTTTNPKVGAGIVGYATENFTADTAGGMGIEFFGVGNAPGATPTPSSLGTWTVAGGLAVATVITPVANDGTALGTTSLKFSDLFLATGAVINVNSGNTTLTGDGAGKITLGGSQANGVNLTLAAGGTTLAPLTFTSGTNKSTVAAGDVEFDGVNYYSTIDTSSGRGCIPVEQYRHLTADGSTISTIANFFGATSNISLVANAYYEIEIMLVFLKTTAGTLTVTLTNSAAPTSQNIYWEQSPITGVVAPPGTATALTGFAVKDATAAKAIVTGTLTTGVDHYIFIKIQLQNGTGTSLKIQGTASAGTITPRHGSYWKARRMSPNNIGTFAA